MAYLHCGITWYGVTNCMYGECWQRVTVSCHLWSRRWKHTFCGCIDNIPSPKPWLWTLWTNLEIPDDLALYPHWSLAKPNPSIVQGLALLNYPCRSSKKKRVGLGLVSNCLRTWTIPNIIRVRLKTSVARCRGGSASIRILYTYVTSSGNIRYDKSELCGCRTTKEVCRTADFGTICSKLCSC